MTDLSTLKPQDTTTIEILHPATRIPIGVQFEVYNSDSKVARAAQHKIKNRMIKKRTIYRTAEEVEQDNLDFVTACVKGWKNLSWDGKKLTFNKENMLMVFEELPWIFDQVNEAIGNIDNFLA